jgi:hypothetical protein
MDTVNGYTYVAMGLVLLEVIVLLAFNWSCPLTGIARQYSDSNRDNFDIFLPEWLAKHNKTIFGLLFAIGVILVIYRALTS